MKESLKEAHDELNNTEALWDGREAAPGEIIESLRKTRKLLDEAIEILQKNRSD